MLINHSSFLISQNGKESMIASEALFDSFFFIFEGTHNNLNCLCETHINCAKVFGANEETPLYSACFNGHLPIVQ